MRVLLIYPPYRHARTNYPLGLAHIGTELIRHGHQVQVIDADAFLYSRRDVSAMLKDYQYDIVGIGSMITAYKFVDFVITEIKRIKHENIKIIVGGSIITPMPELFMQNNRADIGVIGEGERTVVEVVECLEKGRSLEDVNGIIFRRGDRLYKTKPREFIRNLDDLQFPYRKEFFIDIYTEARSSESLISAKKRINILTGRGCPYQCTFCFTETSSRRRSIDSVLDEIESLKEKYNVGHFTIQDDLFFMSRTRVREFCDKIYKRKIKITWKGAGRANLIDRELVRMVKEAGCTGIGFGIESGSPRILKRIKKKITPNQVVDAAKIISEEGLTPGGNFIFGLPGENYESIRESVELIKELNKYRRGVRLFFFATPYPGTELYDEVKSMGRISNEVDYFHRLSEAGDAISFVVNCTSELSDEELLRLKADAEREIRKDFRNKHKWLYFWGIAYDRLGINYIKKFIIYLRINGLSYALRKVFIKLGEILRLKPSSVTRWSEMDKEIIKEKEQV
jgi:radical SAM superfamily enzyme YgiQ (UPF0313 family)